MCVCVCVCVCVCGQLFDKEGKGYISREELQIILRNAFTMNGDESSQLFDQVDVDRDGKISFGKCSSGVTVSMLAFLACHQFYCAGSSLAWGLNLRVVVCGIF